MSQKLENSAQYPQKSQDTVIETDSSSPSSDSSLLISEKTVLESDDYSAERETFSSQLPLSQKTVIENNDPFNTGEQQSSSSLSFLPQKTTIETNNFPSNNSEEVSNFAVSNQTVIENNDPFNTSEQESPSSLSFLPQKTTIETNNFPSNNSEEVSNFAVSNQTVIENNDPFNTSEQESQFSNVSSSQEISIEAKNIEVKSIKKEYKRTKSIDAFLGKNCGENDRYQIIKLLGIGGMGQVYLALTKTEKHQYQLIAIKFLKKDFLLADNRNEIERRFNREIRILMSLNHPNIVKIIDQGFYNLEENNQIISIPFYVMEYLNGQSLTTYLQTKHKLNFTEAMPLMIQILSGLTKAHQNNIIHRDLKPDNIFLLPLSNSRYMVKILDFGIAKNFNNISAVRLTNVDDYFGTPYYISPEHIKGIVELDSRSDIYVLGLIFYEILSGNKPFNVDEEFLTTKGWFGVHNSKKPNQLTSQSGCEKLPVSLNDIIMKCLEKNPEQRFTNAQELLEALSSLSFTEKTQVKPLNTPIETKQKQLLSKLLLIGFGFILGIFIGIFIGILINSTLEAKNSPQSTILN